MLQDLIAQSLSLTPNYVSTLGASASHRYKHFTIPKASGGIRHIYHPAKPLKAVQRWLQSRIVTRWTVHNAAAAYRKGRNIADHARLHLGSRYLLHLDLVDFFESITASDIHAYIQHHTREVVPSGWADSDTELFVQLVCLNGRLTIGAVTSPGISNALCQSLDHSLTTRCLEIDVTYTRYADDMFFSTSSPHVLSDVPRFVIDTLRSIPYPTSLTLNLAKTRHSSLKGHRRVTGLVLSSQGTLSLGRRFKRAIRTQIYRIQTLSPRERSELSGRLAFVKDVEPAFFNRLVLKYGNLVSQALQVPPSTTD